MTRADGADLFVSRVDQVTAVDRTVSLSDQSSFGVGATEDDVPGIEIYLTGSYLLGTIYPGESPSEHDSLFPHSHANSWLDIRATGFTPDWLRERFWESRQRDVRYWHCNQYGTDYRRYPSDNWWTSATNAWT